MSLRERLKSETRVCHERLEADLDLTRDDFSLDDLRTLVERFYGYYAPCEGQIQTLPEPLRSFLDARRKLPLLERDLRHFDHTEATLRALARCPVPPLNSAAQALGRWYVLEGSTLGGQLLAKHFVTKFELANGAGCEFFTSYGPDVGTRWREFCQLLDEYSSPATNDEAVDAANETFATLSDWLPTAHEPKPPPTSPKRYSFFRHVS
jgi:heme oxygenase